MSATVGCLLTGTAAYAATNWIVGLGAGSSGQAQSSSISNISITAVASPSPGNQLYPGVSGDVVVLINNPNPFPVTITAVQTPANTVYAGGFSDSALTTPRAGCSAATPSGVIWNFATATSGLSHTLTTPITVAASGQANNPLTVTFTRGALMADSSPSACASTHFSMPSLTSVSATSASSAATVTTTPATTGWTS